MFEALIVLVGVGALALFGLVVPLLPAEWVVEAGWRCTLAGLALGVPTGFWYHVRLRAVLAAHGGLEPRWWLRPATLHPRLPAGERPRVLRWFYAGGLGFVLCALGCLLVGAGVVLEGLRAGVF